MIRSTEGGLYNALSSPKNAIQERSFLGLKLQGAVCRKNLLSLSATISTDLPLTSLRWIRLVTYLLNRFITLTLSFFLGRISGNHNIGNLKQCHLSTHLRKYSKIYLLLIFTALLST